MELRPMAATLSPLPTPRDWRALARRLTLSWSWAKVRRSPSQAIARRSGTTDAAIIRNSDVFILYLRCGFVVIPLRTAAGDPARGGGGGPPGAPARGRGAGRGRRRWGRQ